MNHRFRHIRSRLGAKIMVGFFLTLALTAAALIAASTYLAHSLSQEAASESGEALREQARSSLERLTHEQARRYDQFFREAGNRSRVLARRAEHQLTLSASTEPAFPLTLHWRPDKAFHTNSAEAPISLLHWGSPEVSAAGRRDMRLLTHLGTALGHAQEEVFGATAAWITTAARVVGYAPNRPLIEAMAPAPEEDILGSRFYTIATPDQAPEGGTQWTRAYQDPAGQGLMITASTPIYGPDEEHFFGVAGIDLTLTHLASDILSQDLLNLSPDSSTDGPPREISLLMDNRARPVALSREHRQALGLPSPPDLEPSAVLDQSLAESRYPELRQAVRQAVAQDSLIVDHLTLAGTDYLAIFQAVPATGWVLANVVAEDALLRPVHTTREVIGERVTRMVGILAAATLVLLLLIWSGLLGYFTSMVIRPLGRLSAAAERMRAGEYGVRVPVRGQDELARLGRAFNEISERLTNLIQDLEDQVKERTREAESARDHFRSILQSSPVGIAFLDGERRVRRANAAFEELTGRPAEEVLGHNTRFLYRDPSEFERVGHEAYPILKTGSVYRTVITLQRPDGTPVIVSLIGQAVNPEVLEEGFIWVLQDITEQRQRERTLQQFRAVFEGSRDAVMLTDENGFFDCNAATVRLFQAPDQDTVLRYHPADLSPTTQPDGRLSTEAAREYIREAFAEGVAFFEWTHCTVDGVPFPTEVHLSRIDLDSGPILEAVVRDISEQKQAIEQIRQARDRAETYFEVVRVMMLVLDTNGRVAAINQRGCELLGLPREAILGADWFTRFVPDTDAAEVARVFEDLKAGHEEPAEYMENEVMTAAGERRIMAFRNAVLYGSDGEVEGILSSGADITQQRELEAELQRQASHDPLTGIYNRRKGAELLYQEITRAQRYASPLSVLLFDLDYFKTINDRYGHDIGDTVLRELTAIATRRLREADILARWGGEEFLVLLPETSLEGASRAAEDLRQHVAETEFSGVPNLTISVGMAELREDDNVDRLLKRVDNALYVAKNGGRNRVA